MKTGQNGINLIKKYEGCRLISYKCPSGKWTIGYGHTSGVTKGMAITQAKVDEFLRQDLVKFERLVEKYNGIYKWNQNEFDALVSFAFNIGNINQLTANGTRTKEQISTKMLEYVKSGGQTLLGLVKRRKEEQELFLTPIKTGVNMGNIQNQKVILKIGSKGDDVREIQEKLSAIGYSPGVADGFFGEKTKSAVIEFQNDFGLTADGIVGIKTWAALDEINIYSLKKDSNKAISDNFKVKEFACQDKSDVIVLHEDFVKDKLQKIRSHFGVPVTFNSAYRTPTHNKKVGGSSNSFHVKGRAFDIVVKGKTPAEVARYAQSIGIKGIILYNTFVHVDSRTYQYYARNNNGKVTKLNSF